MASTSKINNRLSMEQKLKRFLYTCSFDLHYVVGHVDKYSLKPSKILAPCEFFDEMIKSHTKQFIEIINESNSDPLLPRRQVLFYSLARAINSSHIPTEFKAQIAKAALDISQNDEDFFDFVHYCALINSKGKLQKSVLKAVRRFYSQKQPLQLATSFAYSHGFHKWTHKDLIRTAHVKFDGPSKNVANYILFGKFADEEAVEVREAVALVNNCKNARTTNDKDNALLVLRNMQIPVADVCIELQKSQEFWVQFLTHVPIPTLIRLIPKLHKHKLLKKGLETQTKLCEYLTSPLSVATSKVQPIEVYIATQNYIKSGNHIDKKAMQELLKHKSEEEIKQIVSKKLFKPSSFVIRALLKCLHLSYSNVQPSDKRYCVSIDAKLNEELCIGNKNVNALDAAIVYTLGLIKAERTVHTFVFQNSTAVAVKLDEAASIEDNVKKICEAAAGSLYAVPSAPIELATAKTDVDVFINFLKDPHLPKLAEVKNAVKPADALVKYEKKRGPINAKLVSICLAKSGLCVARDFSNLLDITGFDAYFPKLIHSFSKEIANPVQ